MIYSKGQLTADQIQAKINDLMMRRDQLQSMMDSNVPTSDELKAVETGVNATISAEKKQMANVTKVYACYRYLCEASRTNSSNSKNASDPCAKYKDKDPCSRLNDLQTQLNEATRATTQAQTAGDSAMNQLLVYRGSNGSMDAIIKQLNSQIDTLKGELKNAPKPIPPDAAAANGTGQLSPQEIEENWMSFSFDSETSSLSKVTKSSTFKTAESFSDSGFFWSVGGSASYSRSSQSFSKSMHSADVSVSAKMLRVTFSRNWFQPSIFQLGKLKMVRTASLIALYTP